MAVKYILEQIGYKVGLNPADTGQRAVLLRFVNTAAKELYHISDMAGVYEEQYFKVNSNQTIALPDYVGQVRAMRRAYDHIALTLSQMRPRYNQFNWESEWRNWRLKGLQTLQTGLTNQSQLVLSVAAIEDIPIVANIAGPIIGSSRVSETIAMLALSVNTTHEYLDVASFSKTSTSMYDLILSDIDGNQISYIPANCLKAQFQIIDISTAPWVQPNPSPQVGWVEVLYKKALPHLFNDQDEFPAIGYDEVIITKCLQLWAEEQKDIQSSVAYYQKAQQMLAQIHEDVNRGTDDCVSIVENGHDKFSHRIGFGRDWRFAYRITGR